MDTQGLPREEWGAFFDDLSREFEQGQVTVEVSGDGLPHVTLVENLLLLGIQFNTKGSDAGSITIMAGQDEDAAISHTDHQPDAGERRPRRSWCHCRRSDRRTGPGPDAHPFPVVPLTVRSK